MISFYSSLLLLLLLLLFFNCRLCVCVCVRACACVRVCVCVCVCVDDLVCAVNSINFIILSGQAHLFLLRISELQWMVCP